jgi:nucleotide-binding universal stress UspA family protein
VAGDERRRESTVSRILVATAGASTACGALAAARAIAAHHRAHVSVVTVFQPRIPYPLPREGGFPAILQSDRDPARRQLAVVRQQIAALGAGTDEWSLSLVAGQPAHNINKVATAEHADLVVIGLGRDNPDERGLGDRGSMSIAATVRYPLLSVASTCPGTFRDVMVAVGADDLAVVAFRRAQKLLPAPERLHLVHVVEAIPGSAEAAARHQVAEIRRSLDEWMSARVESWALEGDPIDQLLSFARQRTVDLVVGGLHGQSFAERAIMRNAALWQMAIGERSVLLVPAAG